MISRSSIFHLFVSLLIVVTINGCDNQRLQPQQNTGMPADPVARLLQLAQQSTTPDAEVLRLQAIQLLNKQQAFARAEQLLDATNLDALPTDLKIEYWLAGAETALAQQKLAAAETLLTANVLEQAQASLSPVQQKRLALLKAITFEYQGKLLPAAEERITINHLLPATEQADNQNAIWLDLTSLPTEMLKVLSTNAANPETQGWFTLAWISQAYQNDLDQQIQQLHQWQSRHPMHPAAQNLPASLADLTELIKEKPSHIAVLLPNDGAYAPVGQAIKKGLMAAHYAAREQQPEQASGLTINFYDSSTAESFRNNYQLAINQGAQLIIGPLQKEHVDYLQQQSQLPVPTIALNYASGSATTADEHYGDSTNHNNPDNLYQFGLSAEDEAHQVALRAKQLGYKSAAVLYPEGDWGSRVEQAFAKSWQGLEGQLLNSASFSKSSDISTAIKKLLLVDESETRKHEISRITGKKPEYQPRRRQDLDFVFIFASPQQARQIKPLFAFYFANSLPILASSRVNPMDAADTIQDKDLSNIEFCDIPWLFTKDNNIKKLLTKSWPDIDNRFDRFYALGADAYHLHTRIQLLSKVKNSNFLGETGSLSLKPDQRISRYLAWAKFKDGKIVLIQTAQESAPKPNDTENTTTQEPGSLNKTPTWPAHGRSGTPSLGI